MRRLQHKVVDFGNAIAELKNTVENLKNRHIPSSGKN